MKNKDLVALTLAIIFGTVIATFALGNADLVFATYTSPLPPPTLTATPTKAQLPGPTVTLIRPTNTPCVKWLPAVSNND